MTEFVRQFKSYYVRQLDVKVVFRSKMTACKWFDWSFGRLPFSTYLILSNISNRTYNLPQRSLKNESFLFTSSIWCCKLAQTLFPLSPSSLTLLEDPSSAASCLQWLSPASNGTFGKVATFAKAAYEVVAFDVFDRVGVQLQGVSLPQACEDRWPKTPPFSTSGWISEYLPKE